MERIQITFGKDKTAIIKGVAIIFMILLHVFGGSGWYENDIPMNHNKGLIRFMHSFQISQVVAKTMQFDTASQNNLKKKSFIRNGKI